jgi:hypothetical protein
MTNKILDIKNEALAAIRGTDKESDGTRILSLPKLSGITKGFRRGELVVFTGPTGIIDLIFDIF